VDDRDATDATAKKQAAIYKSLSLGNSVAAACRSARINRSTYYRWLDADEEFKKAVADAIEEGTDRLEDEAKRRAMKQSDTLIIFLLKARRPDKYKDRVENQHTGRDGGPIVITAMAIAEPEEPKAIDG
jgi:transposase-like protein